MNGYLLDTNICIYLLKRRYDIDKRLDLIPEDMRVCISEVTLAELYYGASKSNDKKAHVKEVDIIANLFEVLPIRDCLELYGDNKTQLEREGNRIDDFDLLIGSTAVVNDLVIVTENVKHLGRIPNIALENWITHHTK